MSACTLHPAYARLNRRRLLQAGTFGLLGVPALSGQQASNVAGFSRAKQCLFLFMWGGPSHLDTFDPKPNAPKEVRGPFDVIETSVPGVQFSQHFHRVARHAGKLAVLRSLTHDVTATISIRSALPTTPFRTTCCTVHIT